MNVSSWAPALLPRNICGSSYTTSTPLAHSVSRSSQGYFSVVDLIHYLRAELEPDQLSRFAVLYLGLTHNPCLTISTHILSAKMAYNSVEVIVTKSTSSKHTAAKVLLAMLEISTAKLESMLTVHQDILARAEKTKDGELTRSDMIAIEKSRPYAVALFASEKTESILPGKTRRLRDHSTEFTQNFRV